MKDLNELRRRFRKYERQRRNFIQNEYKKVDGTTDDAEEASTFSSDEEEEKKRAAATGEPPALQVPREDDHVPVAQGAEAGGEPGARQVKIDFKRKHTLYTEFHGMYDDEDLEFNESVYMLLPPQRRLKPSNIYLFQLVLLSSETSIDDVVVGWGVFPLLNSEFEINEGKFKVGSPLAFIFE